MTSIKEIMGILEDSKIFSDWKEKNPNAYLTHAFCMYDSAKDNEWQFGYYLKDKDKMVTFVMEDEISKMPESEILKKEDLLNHLDMENVRIELDEALLKAKECQEKDHKGQLPMKIIVLLQHLNEGLVWNITYLTIGFKTLNIKISAIDGKIVEHTLKSLISQV